jgi:hypothetical protein
MSSGSISELQVVDFTGAKGLENQLYWSILSKNGREPAGIRTKASRERSCGTGNRKKAPARYACRATAQSACSTQPEVAVIQPKLTLIAGANGSGKTTLTRWNAGLFKDIPVLDPDSIGKPLQPTASIAFPIEGARQVLRSANGHLIAPKVSPSRRPYRGRVICARCWTRIVLDLRLSWSTSEQTMSRPIWLESVRAFLQAAMMCLRRTSGVATGAAWRIWRLR